MLPSTNDGKRRIVAAAAAVEGLGGGRKQLEAERREFDPMIVAIHQVLDAASEA
jgi:hypothetical protein